MSLLQLADRLNRRIFLKNTGVGLGAMALGTLIGRDRAAAATPSAPLGVLGGVPHVRPKARRIIQLFQSGAPSQMDLFDFKPTLKDKRGIELPDSIRMGQRITTMTSGQKSLPVAPSLFQFARHGRSGAWLSELLPHTAKIVDDLCIVKSLQTEAINHDPAVTFFQTGSQLAGRPSMGAWVAYGLGSENQDLPAFVVLLSRGGTDQPLYDRLWGSGFLPTRYQGVKLRGGKEPVLYLSNPAGCTTSTRREMLDELGELNRSGMRGNGDPKSDARVAQYELAYRMQMSVPELTDLSKEPKAVLDMYGPDVSRPKLCRQLSAGEADGRTRRPFIQLYHMGWDHHNNLPQADPQPVPRYRSTFGSAGQGPEGSRPAR